MTFPFEEHERRLGAVRASMSARSLDVVLVTDPESLAYLTEHQTTGYSYLQALVVPRRGEPFSLSRALERTGFERRTWVERCFAYEDTDDPVEALAELLRERGLGAARVGIERNSYFLPARQADQLRAALADASLHDCHGMIEAERIRKSDVELEVMARAAAATEEGMRRGIEATSAGARESSIASAICAGMFEAGGEYPAVLPHVMSGPRTRLVHGSWQQREVRPGEPVVLSVAGCFRRYHTALTRTVVCGSPSEHLLRATRALRYALRAAREQLRPGITAGELDRTMRSALEGAAGWRANARSGYSIGIAFAPSWDEGYMLSLKPGSAQLLEAGMTLHLAPWLDAVDERYACGLSDTVRVTEAGCESFFEDEPTLVTR